MSWRLTLLVSLIAAGAGWLVGRATRPETPDKRPGAIEDLLRAVDRLDRRGGREALESALTVAGSAARYGSPWREEVEFAQVVARGDAEALWRFASDGPRMAPRARALLHLARTAPTAAERARATARLRADYPDSWALRAPAPATEGAGR